MKKILIAALVGGVVAFLWGFVSWAALGFSNQYTHEFENEDAVLAALAEGATEPGFYLVPGMRDADGEMRDMEAWQQMSSEGPYAQVMLRPEGMDHNPAMMMPRGLLLEIVAALLIALLVAGTGPSASFVGRARVGFLMGLFAGVAGPMINWNFMGAPLEWSLFLVMDTLVTWTLAGIGVAAVLKPAE